jgi:2-(1,2-epoxy-1,2-dihydrophenyl)acetyl-CoA isomerase
MSTDFARPRVRFEVTGRIGHLVLSRPEAANAIDDRLCVDLASAVEAAHSADLGVLLVRSSGAQFCAGGDVRMFIDQRLRLPALIDSLLETLLPAATRLVALPVPLISVVQGPVGGAGIALALCADVVLASTSMKLRAGYSALGLSPDLGASFWLERRAGPCRAKQLLLTNRVLDAAECLTWGLVDQLYPPESLGEAALELAGALANGSAGSLVGIKRLIDGPAMLAAFGERLQAERALLLQRATHRDVQEGLDAFIAKRAPRFGANAGASAVEQP